MEQAPRVVPQQRVPQAQLPQFRAVRKQRPLDRQVQERLRREELPEQWAAARELPLLEREAPLEVLLERLPLAWLLPARRNAAALRGQAVPARPEA